MLAAESHQDSDGRRSSYEQVYEPVERSRADRRRRFGVVAPVTLAFDIYKDKDHFRLVGHRQDELELRAAVPRAVRAAGRCAVRPAVPAARRENTGDDERESRRGRSDDGVLRGRRDRPEQLMREQFYLALPMKPLCRETARECARLRDQPESRPVRLQAAVGRSAVGGAEER